MDSINLAIKFVSASEEILPGSPSQTGDTITLISIFLILLFLLFGSMMLLVQILKANALKRLRVAFSPKIPMARHIDTDQNQLTLTSNNKLKFLVVLLSFLMVFSIIGIAYTGNAFAVNGGGSLQPSTNDITATIQDDGSVDFSTCDLTNISEETYTLSECSVSICDDVKTVEALGTSIFKIYGFDGVLFDGNPDGEPYSPIDITTLKAGDSTVLNFALNNIDKNSLLALIDKQVFTISMVPVKTYDVIFDAQGHGEAPAPYSNIVEGEKIIAPEEPTETGWLFNG